MSGYAEKTSVAGSRLTDSTCANMVNLSNIYVQSTVHIALIARYMRQFDLVYSFRDGKRHANVLDVGCNNAAALRMYFSSNFQTPRRRPLSYCGYDLSDKALVDARANVPRSTMLRGVDLRLHDITERWPADDLNFDVIWYTETIEHVPADAALYTLHEAYRVARPGAIMLLSTPAPFDSNKLVWPDSHDHEFSREEMRDMIDRAGWRRVDEYGLNTNWSYGRRRLRELDPELFAIYEKLRGRLGGTIARTMVAALAPDVCDDLVHICVK